MYKYKLMLTRTVLMDAHSGNIIITLAVLIMLISCQSVDAYTEDSSVTQYRVPGVSIRE